MSLRIIKEGIINDYEDCLITITTRYQQCRLKYMCRIASGIDILDVKDEFYSYKFSLFDIF